MSARSSVRSRGGDRLTRSEPFELFKRPQRSLPARIVGLIVRLRAELLVLVLLGGLAAGGSWLVRTHGVSPWTVDLSVGVPAVGVAFWPAGRRYLVRRGWAVLTRHRLRAVFVECRVMNFSGNLPLLLWSRPSPVGERVWVLLRAGIDLRDIELRLSHIAVGCLAQDARVSPHRWMAALVVVEVVRRDPLVGRPVASPMAKPAQRSKPAPGKPDLRVVPVAGGGSGA